MNDKSELTLSFNILDLLYILKKWKKVFITYILVVIIASIVILLLLPLSYKATTLLFPPKQDNALNLPSQISFAKLSGSLFSPKDDLENQFIAIFNSRTLKENVIQEFDLIREYKFDKQKKYYFEDVIKEYNKHFFFSVSDEGMMVVEVIDGDSKKAADMADFVAKKMDEIYRKLMTESARNNRQFIEDRLQIVIKDLDSSEKELNKYQNQHSLVDIESQTKVTIEALSMLEAQIISARQKLEISKRIYNYNSPEIKQLELEISTMQQQKSNFAKKNASSVFLPLNTVPDLGLEYLKLKRNLLVQENIYEFAVQQHEAAKFEEAKQTPNLLVLDSARIPDKRYKPKRTRLLILSVVLNSIFCFMVILFIEYWMHLKKSNIVLYTRINNLFKSNKQ
jgi:uncharacterized protein involved in exopolysaccharide biosynthesis